MTTCNYVARQYGCRSGMAGFVAKKLCPNLVFLKPDFQKYNAKAHEVREVLVEYDPRFESASIDEAYLNITEYCSEHNMEPADVVEQMRREVHQKTDITVSAGIAANAKLAKICSNMNKPNGQFVLPRDRSSIMTFMRDLPTRKVNGIGRVLERQLLEIGVKTCGDLYEYRQYLYQLFGEKAAEFLIKCYLGLGRTKIQPAEEYERKSVGTESTFSDMSDPVKLREKLRWTAEELEKDMKRAECKGRTLCLKVKLHTFEVFTRQVLTPRAICLADDLYNFSLPILAKLEQDRPGLKLRLMGLRCTHLVSTKRPDTMAFFGFKPRGAESAEPGPVKRKASGPAGEDEVWEEWPEEELLLDGGDRKDVSQPPPGDDGYGDPDRRRHGKEIAPNPLSKKGAADAASAEPEEQWWTCPICSRPQAADERRFNDHIDMCLSRQTIRDAVRGDTPPLPQPPPPPPHPAAAGTTHDAKKPPRLGEKRRGRPSSHAAPDPKQRKLTFG